MKILILSLDHSLLIPEKRQQGDTLLRFKDYSQKVDKLLALVPLVDSKKQCIKVNDRLSIYGCYGASKLFAYLNVIKEAFRIIRQENIDIIDANDAVLGFLALIVKKIMKRKIKVGISVFGLEIFEKSWLQERWQNRFLRKIHIWAISRADLIRTDNQKNKKMLIKKLHLNPRKIFIISVIPSKQFIKKALNVKPNPKLRKSYLKKNKQKIVLSIGNLEEVKDYPNLLFAFKQVVKRYPPALLMIAGEGKERTNIERLIKKLNLNEHVNLLGSISYQQIPAFLASSNLFVLSSSHEGLPRTLMEACLVGIPIVTTNIHGANHLIKADFSGKIVPIKNSKSLSKAMLFMLKNEKKAKLFAKRAKAEASNFLDFEKNVEKLTDYWQKLAKKK